MPINQDEPTVVKSETIKLSAFLTDCLSLGCLKGFKHFQVYLRGREELLLRVHIDIDQRSKEVAERHDSLSLVKSQSHALFSPKTRQTLNNGSSYTDTGSPPFSPIDRELARDESNHVFLIAGYPKYKCPYVWLRSNHKRLIQLQDDQKLETDSPLKLDTIAAWKNQDIRLWDIIAEVMTLSLTPQAPENPFEIDHSYYDTLPLEESVVRTGAMVYFLQNVYLKNTSYADKIFEDIKLLQQRHFAAFEEMNEALNSRSLERSNPSSALSASTS